MMRVHGSPIAAMLLAAAAACAEDGASQIGRRQPVTPGALRLEELARALDIDLVPKHRREGRDRLAKPQEQQDLLDLLKARLAAGERDPEPFPGPAGAYLASRRAGIDAVCDHLRSGADIAWEVEWRDVRTAPLPNLLGLLHLARVLVADALEQAAVGDGAVAAHRLLATNMLVKNLLDRPEIISQLIALAIARSEAIALRHLAIPARPVLDELRSLPFRSRLHAALVDEARMLPAIADSPSGYLDEAPEGTLGHLGIWLTRTRLGRSYQRACLTNTMERALRDIERTEGLDPCAMARSCDQGASEDESAWWDLIGSEWSIRAACVYARVGQLLAQLELSAQVMVVDASRARHGRWPEHLPGGEAWLCSGMSWRYRVAADGSAVIEVSPEPQWPNPDVVPLRFKLEPAVSE